MKTFKQLREFTNHDGAVKEADAKQLVSHFKKVFGTIGAGFSLSYHALMDRMNHPRNKPPVTADEFKLVLTKFIQKHSKQLMDDISDVKNRTVTPRGKKADTIRPNNFEYGITSKSTGIAIILAIQPDNYGRTPVRINIITIMRKRGFGVNKGEHIMVETSDHIKWIEVD